MESKKSILITGASSGIGKETALYLEEQGFKVFAGVRKLQDMEILNQEGSVRLVPVILDVTKEETIYEALNIILRDKEYSFLGLVNNAGISMRSVLEIIPKHEFQKVFDVNVIGLHSVTRIFLPLIRKNKGRIVNIGSEAGFMAWGGGGAYSASKFAVRGLTDSLRLEMIPFEVHVSYIAPTSTQSKIWVKNQEDVRLREGISDEVRQGYNYFFKAQDRAVPDKMNVLPAIEVAKDIADALTSLNPKYEYYSGEKAEQSYRASLFPKDRITRCSMKRLSKFIKLYG